MSIHCTKIIVTLDPASSFPEVLERLILVGTNVTCLNFSHGAPGEHRARARPVRELATKHGRFAAPLGDLQGPKTRIAKLVNKHIELRVGDRFRFSTNHARDAGTQEVVGISYPDLAKDCKVSDELLLDDGQVVMVVGRIAADELRYRVLIGGPLPDHKGINRRGGDPAAPALTNKNKVDIKLATDVDLNYVAASFPRDVRDMEYTRRLLAEAGGEAWLVAKIERAEAVADNDALDDLIRVDDTVMAARDDLGVGIDDAELVGIRKKTILHTRRNNKMVITAAQMMESMIHSPMPTRAEVSDMANAMLDYIDAVMLSAESAAGEYPVEAMKTIARICQGIEKHPTSQKPNHHLGQTLDRCDESIALASMYMANHFPGIKATICLTENDFTPLIMSCIRSLIPIYAYSPHRETQARVAMSHGVETIPFDSAALSAEKVNQTAVDKLLKCGVVTKGDWVVLTEGNNYTVQGGTNTVKVLHVGDLLV